MGLHRVLLFVAPLFLFLLSCTKTQKVVLVEEFLESNDLSILADSSFIFLGHTRGDNNRLSKELTDIPFDQFKMVWLGGDLVKNSSGKLSTLKHIDSVFKISAPTTLWSLGNHDVKSIENVSSITKRPSFYTFAKDEMVMLVLNTEMNNGSILGAQLELLNTVCDTIKDSKTLIVLLHKLIWLHGSNLEKRASDISNGGLGKCSYCLDTNNFYKDVYPKFRDLQSKGIQVICLSGDAGYKKDFFQARSNDGVLFIANGMDPLKEKRVLMFRRNKKKELVWRLTPLNNIAFDTN